MIVLDNVSKSYGSQAVLSGFSLRLQDGERVALMGRSGAGKTTVLNLILGLQKPDSGKAEVSKETRFGVVFQEDRLVESLSAEKNCRLAAAKGSEPQELLKRMGITDELIKKPVRELSGGERRRVAIARALSADADVIVLDEPFKGIDKDTLPAVIGEVKAAAQGRTLVLVTHTVAEAEALGCKVVEI